MSDLFRVCTAFAFVFLFAHGVAAQPPARGVVAKATSPAGTFSARKPGSTAFAVLPAGADLYSGDLLVTLPDATLTSTNGAVSLQSLADYDGRSPLPVLDTAFTLNPPGTADLDFTLDRGRVDLTNRKRDGAAVVVTRFHDQEWTITLDGPGTRVALELHGRWPAGARFRAGGTNAAPVAALVLLVLDGGATVDVGEYTLGMKAPPGPALVQWDSVFGTRPQPQRLDELPPWADPEAGLSDDGKKIAAAVEKFRQARTRDPAGAVAAFLSSSNPAEQRVALVTLGALDDLSGLGRVLGGADTADKWDFGISVARHWLGRGRGQDQRLYDALVSPAQGYSPAHARSIMRLLFGFAPDELRQPETYEVLIDYLLHDRPAIRNLAAWHLVRLVPKDKAVPFEPAGTPADYEAMHRKWRELIPPGKLPPDPNAK